jgi:hypothetical protein
MRKINLFISHNSEWKFIADFANLIGQLGYYPIVVEREPDLGLDPNEKSKHYLRSSDIVIFVITKDAIDFSGKPHPKSNVALEIGLAEQMFKPEHKIFFIEQDAKPPSMVAKTYISVQDGNYYGAIARLIQNIRSVLDLPKHEEPPPIEMDEITTFIISELAQDTHGALARPVLLQRVTQKFHISLTKFNLIRSQLRGKGIIVEGEIAIGHDYHGDLFLMLTSLGWDLADKIV